MKINLFNIISVLLIGMTVLLQSCTKNVQCIDFSSEERTWIPYKNGDIDIFQNSKKDSTITLKFRKYYTAQDISNRYEGQGNWCKNNESWYIDFYDSVDIALWEIELDNGTYIENSKKQYYFDFDINRNMYAGTHATSTPIDIMLNGQYYTSVITVVNTADIFDSVYYGKNVGFIAIHKKKSSQWYFKQ